MGGKSHDGECVAAGSTDDIVHLLTDQSDKRVMILDTSGDTTPAEAAENVMRDWPVPDGASPGTRTYCQYGIIYAVPSRQMLCEPPALDGKYSLQEVVSGSDDLAAAYEWVCSLPKVVVHPPEPACPRAPKDGPAEHSWGADWRVVGGVVEDRPGVFGTCSGPGLRIDEHCTRPGCHATRTRDTHTVDEGHDAKQDSYLCISYGELQNEEGRRAHDAVYGTVPGEGGK